MTPQQLEQGLLISEEIKILSEKVKSINSALSKISSGNMKKGTKFLEILIPIPITNYSDDYKASIHTDLIENCLVDCRKRVLNEIKALEMKFKSI